MNIGELLIDISEKCKLISNAKEQDYFILDSILEYMGTDSNNIGNGTKIVVKAK